MIKNKNQNQQSFPSPSKKKKNSLFPLPHNTQYMSPLSHRPLVRADVEGNQIYLVNPVTRVHINPRPTWYVLNVLPHRSWTDKLSYVKILKSNIKTTPSSISPSSQILILIFISQLTVASSLSNPHLRNHILS